ncbi:MAG: AMP-binding protein [Streptococcaceae bacterium]|jgi:acyl-coenzyme A synthetase/AMP-(fatty) acid ligase|nr:AMP-binding protein [Streptococcaceae bacterium]
MLNIKKIKELKQGNDLKSVFFSNKLNFNWSEYYYLVANNIKKLLKEQRIYRNINRVIVVSENSWQTFILYSILTSLGIPFSGIDYTQTENIYFENIKNSESNFIFYSEKYKPSQNFEKILKENDINFLQIEDTITFQTGTKGLENIEELIDEFKSARVKDISSFSFTSGTSGVPKVIYRDAGFDDVRIPILTKLYNFNDSDIFLASLPFYHVSVTGWIRLSLLNIGAIVIADIENPSDLYFKLSKFNITTTLFTPPTLKKIVNIHLQEKEKINLRFIMVGGKTFPEVLKEQSISAFGPIIHEYYGSSETGINTLISSAEYLQHPESSGKPMEGSEVLIVNQKHEKLKEGEIGRIAIHSFQNATGYIHKTLERATIDGKDYILTSDFGKIIDNYIYVTQRSITDYPNSNINVFSLENQIRLHQSIDDVAILTNYNDISVYISYDKDISKLKKIILKNSIFESLKSQIPEDTKLFLNELENINYSLSGKVKYFKLEENK